jgi:hypothetical protein
MGVGLESARFCLSHTSNLALSACLRAAAGSCRAGCLAAHFAACCASYPKGDSIHPPTHQTHTPRRACPVLRAGIANCKWRCEPRPTPGHDHPRDQGGAVAVALVCTMYYAWSCWSYLQGHCEIHNTSLMGALYAYNEHVTINTSQRPLCDLGCEKILVLICVVMAMAM